MTLSPQNASLLGRLRPFAVARTATAAHLERAPFGIDLGEAIDPFSSSSAPFLERLVRLDELTFGPEGMQMPRWVYLDAAELTGSMIGLGVSVGQASEEEKALFPGTEDPESFLPLSVFIAIPTHEPGTVLGHNLASLAGHLPGGAMRGLGGLTKAVALGALRARRQIGATQWASRALYVHTRLGPLELLTALTPAHGGAPTLTYGARIDRNALRSLAKDPRARVPRTAPTCWIRSDDLAGLRELQAQIEEGERWAIVDRPQKTARGQQLPLAPLPREETQGGRGPGSASGGPKRRASKDTK